MDKCCDEWNEKKLSMLDGLEYQSIAWASKKDDFTQPATLDLTKKNNNIANLRTPVEVVGVQELC